MEIARNIVAGIFFILVLFWLFNPASNAAEVIGSIAGGTVSTIQALQGYTPETGGTFYGGSGGGRGARRAV